MPDNLRNALKGLASQRKRLIEAGDSFDLIGLLLNELEKVDKTDWCFFQSAVYKDSIKKTLNPSQG